MGGLTIVHLHKINLLYEDFFPVITHDHLCGVCVLLFPGKNRLKTFHFFRGFFSAFGIQYVQVTLLVQGVSYYFDFIIYEVTLSRVSIQIEI